MIGRETESVLNRAVRYALEHEHEYFTLEHVFLSLLEDVQIWDALLACGGDPVKMREHLEAYLRTEIPKISKGSEDDLPVHHPVATLSIQRLIQRALFHVQTAGKIAVEPQDLLVALFHAKDSKALLVLTEQGIARLDILNYLGHGLRRDRPPLSRIGSERGKSGSAETSKSFRLRNSHRASEEALGWYTLNLNEKAQEGQIDPLVGRERELERIIQVLCRRGKNNPLLVGEAGVGKTALAEGLALRIIQKEIPSLLSKAVVYSLDLGSLLAGAKFRGDFEQRFKRLIQALESKKGRDQEPILFIDEIHTVIGAGAVSGGALDAANLLKPLLTRGSIRCMGSTTYQEFRNVFEKDHALARRFQKIEISEPSIEETVQIIEGLKPQFEQHHQVQYTLEAIRAAVELSAKYLTERFLPDKAIDIVDEVGAKCRIARQEGNLHQGDVTIDVRQVEEIVAQMARIPARSVSIDQKLRLKDLRKDLRLLIFGQDEAIDALVTSIQIAHSGLRTGERPIGSFLFCGPTGVGKTELSKQLSYCLGIPFLRFDMSEYSEKHTISRLIGAPPGYVGFDQAGLLTDGVLKNPYSVVLLDEFEKAHPDVWNILLQVMDRGFLTDQNGRKIDFRNTVLILTSNVGSRELDRRPLGMTDESSTSQSRANKEIEQTFSPEFRNRLDAIIHFNPLSPIVMEEVVQKQLMELESQLLAKSVEVEIEEEVKKWLIERGYNRRMGARPLTRLIQNQLKKPLSEEVLFWELLERGGKVRIRIEDKKIRFDCFPNSDYK